MYYYSLVTVLLMYVTMRYLGKNALEIPQHLCGTVVKRVVAGFFSDIFLALAIVYTNYSKAMCIAFLSTVCIPVCAYFILGDKIKIVDFVAIILSFSGTLLIIQPWNSDQSENKSFV